MKTNNLVECITYSFDKGKHVLKFERTFKLYIYTLILHVCPKNMFKSKNLVP